MPRRIDRARLTLFGGLAAVIAMALYLTLYWETNPPSSLLSGRADPDRIDLYAENVHGVEYSDGKQVQTLIADRLQHYPVRGQSVLTAPRLQSLGKDGELWNTTAATGVLIGDEEIQLQDHVVVTDRAKTMRFETEALQYFPARRQAVSQVAVTMHRFDDVTTAIGMRADLDRKRIELLHKVEGIHVQP